MVRNAVVAARSSLLRRRAERPQRCLTMLNVWKPWDTADTGLNAWAEMNLNARCLATLPQVEQAKRAFIVRVIRHRVMEGLSRDRSAYTHALLRRELGAPLCLSSARDRYPWQTQEWQQGLPLPEPCTFIGMPTATAMQNSPTPQRAASPASLRPSWATEAWYCHTRQAALFRVVARNVPEDAMEAISELPGPWQLVCVQTLLLSPCNYNNPVEFMRTSAHRYRAMP